MGAACLGPWSWLNTAQMPTGGVTVSMNPMDTSEGTLMRAAQFTVSKYCAVSSTLDRSRPRRDNRACGHGPCHSRPHRPAH